MTDVARKLIILSGPTAVGKTALSIALAKRVGCEIISADSIQVYRHMDIGSDKITPEKMQGIPHYLVDCLDPKEAFDVVRFQSMAKDAMEEIYAHGKIPLIVGGTGFYIQSVLKDISFEAESDHSAFRNKLYDLAIQQGNHVLHEMLEKVDPASAQAIHENNVKRVARALEFYHNNGFPISEHNERERDRTSPYRFAYFVLTDEREKLYERIDWRVDQMMKEGLLDEVIALKEMGLKKDDVSMQGLGYKQINAYLDGEYDLNEAIRIIKRDTRHFAKRQLTWFRREKSVMMVDKSSFDYDDEKILAFMLERLKENHILP